jgi:hypothetical protein
MDTYALERVTSSSIDLSRVYDEDRDKKLNVYIFNKITNNISSKTCLSETSNEFALILYL